MSTQIIDTVVDMLTSSSERILERVSYLFPPPSLPPLSCDCPFLLLVGALIGGPRTCD